MYAQMLANQGGCILVVVINNARADNRHGLCKSDLRAGAMLQTEIETVFIAQELETTTVLVIKIPAPGAEIIGHVHCCEPEFAGVIQPEAHVQPTVEFPGEHGGAWLDVENEAKSTDEASPRHLLQLRQRSIRDAGMGVLYCLYEAILVT